MTIFLAICQVFPSKFNECESTVDSTLNIDLALMLEIGATGMSNKG